MNFLESMKTESLHALVIDHHLGELSPEAAEMLEHFLALHPESRAEADRLRETLAVTATAIQRHPELALVPISSVSVNKPRATIWRAQAARAASVAALALITSIAGFMMGRSSPRVPDAASTTESSKAEPSTTSPSSPWARYRLVANSTKGGMTVVRIDPNNTTSALQ